jgi:hypothetical protein
MCEVSAIGTNMNTLPRFEMSTFSAKVNFYEVAIFDNLMLSWIYFPYRTIDT